MQSFTLSWQRYYDASISLSLGPLEKMLIQFMMLSYLCRRKALRVLEFKYIIVFQFSASILPIYGRNLLMPSGATLVHVMDGVIDLSTRLEVSLNGTQDFVPSFGFALEPKDP